MNAAELQAWLLSDGIRDELALVTRATVRSELGNVQAYDDDIEQLQKIAWGKLILAGSVLARSSERPALDAALRIATAALTLGTRKEIRDAGSVLLEKLSNYRAVELALARGLLQPGLNARLGVSGRLEGLARSMQDSVLVEHSGKWLRVNHFQQIFWNRANRPQTWVSASAPTASGKTFLVLQWLLNEIQTTSSSVAVYLAPTRALVSEIEGSLNGIVRRDELEAIHVTSLPIGSKYEDAIAGKTKVIFVLTQERLHLLANVLNDSLKVDLLVADEAHKMGDRQRGVVLQDAIERIERSSPALKVVFVSPATQNPETLLEDAPAPIQTEALDSDAPTVLQNVVLATQQPRRTTEWNLSLRKLDGQVEPIGKLHLAARPTSLKKKLALISVSAGQTGGTLIYTNGPAEAEEVALLISQLVRTQSDAKDAELAGLVELARRGVHEAYQLAPVVRKGVAFHYGNMPSLLREEIERLFRIGKIRFLVCTSTLVEGVNLSCRTIVVRGPRKGLGQPMEPHDFWNLAGRAGRWGNEFQGNIICVDPDDKNAWPEGVPQRKRYPIERETDAVFREGEALLQFITTRWVRDPSELSQYAQLEQVCAYLLTAYLREGSISSLPFTKRHNFDLVAVVNEALGSLASNIQIAPSIAVRHPGVSPVGLQRLLSFFRQYAGDIEELLPAPPESRDAYERMSKIMEVINQEVYPAFQPKTLIPLHALVVLEWLKGFSLASIIKARISYHNRHGRSVHLPKLIRETMEFIEQIARFRAPKYISAYMDVMKLHLTEIGREDLVTNDMDVGIALEFGVSTRTLISLIELGLSRMSAVVLHEKIVLDNLNREEVIAWIVENNDQFDGMDIPAVILREVRHKILGILPEDPTPTVAQN